MAEQRVAEVLVVDDTPENLLMFGSLLVMPGTRPISVPSGEAAIELLADHDFALALLDVRMPGMDGFELAEHIRAAEGTRTLPIIFQTGIALEQRHIFKGYESGAVDYLLQPVDPHILRSKVAVFCQLWRQRHEIEEKNAALERQIEEIERLRGLIPICCSCKKIRQDDGYWQQVEVYISERTGVRFSHGICTECAVELYPDQPGDTIR